MSSLPPEAVAEFTEEQVKTLYPPNLQLKYVQIFFRHGERTPVRARLQQAGIPPYWDVCTAADEFRSTALLTTGDFHSLRFKRRLEEPLPNGHLKTVTRTGKRYCLLGELTDQGRLSTSALGQRIRKLYVDQLKYLPKELVDSHTLYIRTSHVQRTVESMTQVFTGLYPTEKGRAIPHFHLRLVSQENLYPNDDFCVRLKKLSEAYSVRAAEEWDPKLQAVSEALRKWVPDGITVNGRPKANGLLDTINSSLANGVPLPPELLDTTLRKELESAAVAEWFIGYLESETYRRLGVGPLLGDVLDRFTYVTHNNTKQKMALYGTHDTTIAALLATLGVFDKRWPCFTSNITLELFKEKNNGFSSLFNRIFGGDEYFVRMRYNHQVMMLPECQAKGKHRNGDESLCTLKAFKEIVEKVRPQDWAKDCRVIESEKEPKYQLGAHQ